MQIYATTILTAPGRRQVSPALAAFIDAIRVPSHAKKRR